MSDDLSFSVPATSFDRRPAFQRTETPLPSRVRKRCEVCGKAGPFRSARFKRCVNCESAPNEFSQFYKRVYQMARSIAVAKLIRLHHDEYDRLMDEAWPDARERVIQRHAAEAEVAARAAGRKSTGKRDPLSTLPEVVREQMEQIRAHQAVWSGSDKPSV